MRRLTREAAGIANDEPAIVSGHEPELVHPGVLAKHVMAQRLAEAVGGKAINLIVDHDAPKQRAVDVPVLADGPLTVRTLTYAGPPRGRAFELLPPLSAEQWADFEQELRSCLKGPALSTLLSVPRSLRPALSRFDNSMLPLFLTAARSVASPRDWVDQWAPGRRAVEAEIGIHVADRRTSELWGGPFLAELIVNARRFAASYNAALAAHRQAQRIRSTQRPIPDLIVEADRVEVPAWVYRRGEARRRLFVCAQSQSIALFAEAEPLGALDAAAMQRWETAGPQLAGLDGVMFRPRALTLTLWARLFLADLFIHGIGGAKYDRITDAIIRDYFGIEPPAMVCVTATLLLDIPRHHVPPGGLAAAQRRRRDLRFNPQRYHNGNGHFAELLSQRKEAIERSDTLRAVHSKDRAERRQVFERIRAINEQLFAAAPEAAERIEQEVEQIEQQVSQNAIANRRDYFFGFHFLESLATMLDQLPTIE